MIGPAFRLESVEEICEAPFAAVYEAVSARILKRDPAEAGRFAFSDEQARQRLLSTIPADVRAALRAKLPQTAPSRRAGDARRELPADPAVSLRASTSADSSRELSAPARTAVFRKNGDYWELSSDHRTHLLRDVKGFHYLAYLLQRPGREVHVLELALVSFTANDPRGEGGWRHGNGDGAALLHDARASSAPSGETLIDTRARNEYKARLAELRIQLDEADMSGDLGRATVLRDEVEALTEALSAAFGLGGRSRVAAQNAERARSAVCKRLREAIQRIGQCDAAIADHLSKALRTGMFCVYRPDATLPWAWSV